MKPLQHAKGTAGRCGGRWQDYIHLHNFIDSSKATFATTAHRALLHNELGLRLATMIFGDTVRNTDGALVPVPAIVSAHLEEDVGRIPTLDDWLAGLPCRDASQRVRPTSPKIRAMRTDPCGAAAALFGGSPRDYQAAVSFFDLCDSMSDLPLRDAFLHNSFGIWLAEQALGAAIETTDSSGRLREVPVREFGEHLVQARMSGFIPSPQQLFGALNLAPWMRGAHVADAIRHRRRFQRDEVLSAAIDSALTEDR